MWSTGENRYGGVGVDLPGLRQTADRLSQAALILHSPAPSWSPPARCLPLIYRPPASPRITQRHQKAPWRAQPQQGGEARHWPASRAILCATELRVLRRTGGSQGALSDPRLLSLPGERLCTHTGLPLSGDTCMDAPWPRSSAGFSF